MRAHNVPEWYIESCKKIKYMFPKAHASAYVTDAMRMGWYKINYPLEFYAAQFSARFSSENFKEITLGTEAVKRRMDEIDVEVSDLTKQGETNKANKLKRLKTALNLALEAKVRGVKFGNIRLYESHANEYRIDYEKNELIPPFSSIDGIGETVAQKMFDEAQKSAFLGVDDLQSRTGANKTNIDILRSIGCLENVEAKQHTFF
jgi:DNA polymerase-3 subunit alpha (Gram-positive type)